MKTSLALLALAGTATANGFLTEDYVNNNHHALFAVFKQTHAKTYATASEEAARKQVFKSNMLKAAQLQAKAPSATYGMNKFSDMTDEEFHPYAHGIVHVPTPTEATIPTLFDAPATPVSVDWRQSGSVSAVKDQGQCGSCWTFSATGAIESHNFLHGDGKLTTVSEQELVSCDDAMHGCMGGLPLYAFLYIVNERNGEIVTEEAYPYTSGSDGDQGECKFDSSMAVGATLKDFVNDIPKDEAGMAAWVAQNGPVSVILNAATWQSYTGGVMTAAECPPSMPNHGVLVVGVTPDYWIVKNSWAASWGEQGYIRLAYGTNTCGLVGDASAPSF